MPSKWETVKLGDICQASRSRVDPRLMDPTEKLVHYSIPILDATGLPEKVQAKTIQSHKFRITEDSVLVSMLNPRIPRVFNAYGAENSVGSTEFSVLSPIGDSDIRLNFLYLLCSSKALWEYLESVATGSTGSRKRAKTQNLLDYEVPLPSLGEQRRIVDLIGALDDAIEAAKVRSASVQRVQAEVLNDLISLPDDRPAFTLGDAFEVIDCEHKTAPESVDEQYAFSVGTGAIRDGVFRLDRAKPVSKETFGVWTQRAIPSSGDVVLTREAPVGEVALVSGSIGPICLGQRTVLLRAKGEMSGRVLWSVLRTSRYQTILSQQSIGLTVSRINIKAIKAIKLPNLSIEVAQKISEISEALMEEIESAIESISVLRALRSELLTALLSGAHEIPESYDEVMNED